MAWFRWSEGSLILELAIQPGSKHAEIAGLHGTALKIRIQAPPIDGKANRALIEYLAGEFATPRSRISIVRGESSRTKIVRIDRPAELPTAFQAHGLSRA